MLSRTPRFHYCWSCAGTVRDLWRADITLFILDPRCSAPNLEKGIHVRLETRWLQCMKVLYWLQRQVELEVESWRQNRDSVDPGHPGDLYSNELPLSQVGNKAPWSAEAKLSSSSSCLDCGQGVAAVSYTDHPN